MGKKEYAQANKDWLAEKAKEEGVKELSALMPSLLVWETPVGKGQRSLFPLEAEYLL